MEDHFLAFKNLCRVCKLRINKKETNSRAADCCKELGQIFGIEVWKDEGDIHPEYICHRCYRKVKHTRNGTRKYAQSASFSKPNWTKHSRTSGDCVACDLFYTSKSGTKGNHGKYKNLQRTTASLPTPERKPLTFSLQDRDIFKFYESPSSSDHRLDINSKLVPITQHHFFICSICLCILSNPVQSDCQDSFCSECLTKLFQFRKDISIPCPVCFKLFFFDSVRRCPILLLAQLSSLNVTCSLCSSSGTLSQLNHHKCPTIISSSSAKHNLHHVKSQFEQTQLSPISQAAKTLNELAKTHRAGDPVPLKIAEATEKWVWLKLKASQDKMTQLRTRGRPATIHQVAMPTKTSEEVSAAYRHQRSNSIASFREFISKGATEIQLEDEALKYITKLDVDQSLAMMKDMQTSWQALRDQRRYLALLKTGMASENAMLARRKEIIDDNLIAEMVPMVHSCDSAAGKSGIITKPTPMVYTRNLCSHISAHLDEHEQLGNLYWHNGLVPEDEIWVKMGADKGGKEVKTMKFNYQILNVKDPNSVLNTVNFALFEAHDTITNITISMQRIKEQISSLNTMTWRGKRIRILIYGDCEFLCKAYGILGCNASFACPYCEGSYKEWQTALEKRGKFQKRTLENISGNLKIYKDHGSVQAKAKLISKSIVREPLIAVQPENIVVPTLHIGLGIYKNLYDKLEADCHAIDLLLYKGMLLDGEVGDGKDNFEQEVNRQLKQNGVLDKKIEEAEEEIEILQEDIPLQLYETSNLTEDQEVKISAKVLAIIGRKNKLQEEVKSMKESKKNICLEYAKGPVASSLDDVLQAHKVQRQAYHGKAFVGNHVNKLCKDNPIEDLCEHAVESTNKMLATNPDNVSVAAIAAAKKVKNKFKPMLSHYADVHNKVNLGRQLTQEEINDVGISIRRFLASYRELAQGRITLKMHVLEDHTVDQISRFRAGLGKLNESGGEATHAAQNKDVRRVYSMTHQPLERLHFLMKEHFVQVHPKIRSESLKVKNKKRKHKDD